MVNDNGIDEEAASDRPDAPISGYLCGPLHLAADEFDLLVNRAAAELLGMGIPAQATVGLLLRNDISFLLAMTACGRLGIYPATLNWQSHPDEIAYVLNDCTAAAVLVEDDLLPGLLGAIPAEATVYAVGRGLGEARIRANDTIRRPILDWNARILERPAQRLDPRPASGVITYTSGTTGKPKGVRRQPYLDKASESRHAAMLSRVFGIGPDVRTLVCAPLYHSGPSAYTRLALRHVGDRGLILLHRKFEPEQVLADIGRFGITHMWMVPTMFHRLLGLPEDAKTRADLSSLRWITVSAAQCPVETKAAMIEWFGPVINEFYGTTEVGPITLADSADAGRKPGTVGRALPDIALSIRTDEGTVLGPGQVGEVCCRNTYYPDFTYINRAEDRRALDIEDQLKTGDVGEVDEDGYLFILDRKKDMVIVGGVNIYPAEIEAVLDGMPGLFDCAVLGLPDAEYGEVLVAAVVRDTGSDVTADDVRAHVAGRLAKYKVPRSIFFLDEIPRQESGKLFKRRLRESLRLPDMRNAEAGVS